MMYHSHYIDSIWCLNKKDQGTILRYSLGIFQILWLLFQLDPKAHPLTLLSVQTLAQGFLDFETAPSRSASRFWRPKLTQLKREKRLLHWEMPQQLLGETGNLKMMGEVNKMVSGVFNSWLFFCWLEGGFGRLGGLLYFVPVRVCYSSEVLQRLIEMDESHCILEKCGMIRTFSKKMLTFETYVAMSEAGKSTAWKCMSV